MELILYIILVLGGIALLVLFGLLLFSFVVYTSHHLWIPVACAGKAEVGMLHWRRGLSMYSNEFLAPDGRRLTPKEYKAYVTRGDSMRLCGILNGAVLFVRMVFRFDEHRMTFPKILLLKRDKSGWDNWMDNLLMWLGLKPSYKVRRAWSLYRVGEDNDNEILERIHHDQSFAALEANREFMGWDEMKKNFKEVKLVEYMKKYSNCKVAGDENHLAIISTTLHKKDNQIKFSIHPVRVIEGEVECYYNVSSPNEPSSQNLSSQDGGEQMRVAG